MNENWKFSDIPYTRPDTSALQSRFDELTRRAKNAGSAGDLLSVVRELDALRQEISLCDSQSLALAISESPYASAVDEAYGPRSLSFCSNFQEKVKPTSLR